MCYMYNVVYKGTYVATHQWISTRSYVNPEYIYRNIYNMHFICGIDPCYYSFCHAYLFCPKGFYVCMFYVMMYHVRNAFM